MVLKYTTTTKTTTYAGIGFGALHVGTLSIYIIREVKKQRVVQSYSAIILCAGHIYKDFRYINFYIFRHVLGVSKVGSTLKKVDFQVSSYSNYPVVGCLKVYLKTPDPL